MGKVQKLKLKTDRNSVLMRKKNLFFFFSNIKKTFINDGCQIQVWKNQLSEWGIVHW